MKKVTIALIVINVVLFNNLIFAGEWKYLPTGGWYYQKDFGTFLQNEWAWLDYDGDGFEERYYFGSDGVMLVNTKTPDGLYVNDKGQWVINNEVQTRKIIEDTKTQTTFNEQTKENVLIRAREFIQEKAYSRRGLINALKVSGYTSINAIFAADNISVDWSAQAVRAVKEYRQKANLSKANLKNVLVRDGFSDQDIEYALKECGIK